MTLNRFAASALAAIIGVSGIGAILSSQARPIPVEGIELETDRDDRAPGLPDPGEPAIIRPDDDDASLDAVDDDDDDPTGPFGDGDATQGDDGTSGGNNTGDGDATRGDDGTSGGNNTGDGDNTRGDDGTSGGNNTADADSADDASASGDDSTD
jgi:hypothetical protein